PKARRAISEQTVYGLPRVWLGQYLPHKCIKWLPLALAERALLIAPGDHGLPCYLLGPHAGPLNYVQRHLACNTIPLSSVLAPDARDARCESNQDLQSGSCEHVDVLSLW